jgi:hypothetical protein
MEIIRNCWHHSSIYTGIEYAGGQPRHIVKTSFSPDGVRDIVNEARGLVCYAGRLATDPESLFTLCHQGAGYARMKIKYFEGTPAKLGRSLIDDERKLANAIHYWFEHFAASGFSHGDYSIDNILYDKDKVVWITDWEHFTNQLPPWFDTLYCLVEACFFRYRRQGGLPVGEIQVYRRYRDEIAQYFDLTADVTAKPSQTLRDQFLTHSTVFGRQLEKYPFVNSDRAMLVKLDDCLNR